MPAITNQGAWSQVRGGPDGDILCLPFAFTTDGSGVPTLVEDYNGLISIGRAAAVYTVTVGTYRVFLACPHSHSLASTLTCTRTHSAANGTVIFTFSADTFNSATFDGCLYVSEERI